MNRIDTERLELHPFTEGDADFVLRLLNEPSFLRYIGDRGVHDLESARRYIADGPVASYATPRPWPHAGACARPTARRSACAAC